MRVFHVSVAGGLLFAAAVLLGGCKQDDAGTQTPPANDGATPRAGSAAVPTLRVNPALNEVKVSWSAVPKADGYRLYWRESAPVDSDSPTIDLGANVTTYLHTGLTGGTTYHYRLAALFTSDEGEWSAEAVAVPSAFRRVLSDAAQ